MPEQHQLNPDDAHTALVRAATRYERQLHLDADEAAVLVASTMSDNLPAWADNGGCVPCQERARTHAAGDTLARDDDTDDEPDESNAEDEYEPTVAQRWSGVIGVEGELTGDGRFIQPGALRWEDLPIPLRYVSSDVGAHQGAEVVGRIDTIERAEPDDEGRVEIRAGGDFDLGSDHGREAARVVYENLMRGVSMDLDDVAFEVRIAADAAALTSSPEDALAHATTAEPDEDGRVKVQEMAPDDEVMVTTGARVRAATLVAVAAFARAKIAPEDEDAGDAAAAVTASGDPEDDEGPDTEEFEIEFEDEEADGHAYNWVEDVGGLPRYIKEISKAIRRTTGMPEGQSIAIAVNATKKMCATGDLNFPGKQNVNPGSRAKACTAVAQWEEKKARARADAGESTAFRERTKETREKNAEKGEALPDGSFPIVNCQDLKNAIKAAGRANEDDRDKVHAHIKKRAKALDCEGVEIPEGWSRRSPFEAAAQLAELSQLSQLTQLAQQVSRAAQFDGLDDLDAGMDLLYQAEEATFPSQEYLDLVTKALPLYKSAVESGELGEMQEETEETLQMLEDFLETDWSSYITEETDIGAGDEGDIGVDDDDDDLVASAGAGQLVPMTVTLADGQRMRVFAQTAKQRAAAKKKKARVPKGQKKGGQFKPLPTSKLPKKETLAQRKKRMIAVALENAEKIIEAMLVNAPANMRGDMAKAVKAIEDAMVKGAKKAASNQKTPGKGGGGDPTDPDSGKGSGKSKDKGGKKTRTKTYGERINTAKRNIDTLLKKHSKQIPAGKRKQLKSISKRIGKLGRTGPSYRTQYRARTMTAGGSPRAQVRGRRPR